MLVNILEKIENFDQLKTEVLELIDKVGFEKNQIICQGLASDPLDWHTGIGRIEELEDRREREYSVLNPALNGTYLASIIEKYQGFRTRIMCMPSRQCYSIHYDPTSRIHIPIVTNSQAWMIWPFHNECHRMPAGNIYQANTTKPHTFINGHTENRIHIVIGTQND
jgi:hypothetical protein